MATTLFLHTNDPRTLADLESAGLDAEQAGVSFEPADAPLFKAGCPVLSLGQLETYISSLLDAEQGILPPHT